MDSRTETRLVKQALKNAGIPHLGVRHGTGTAASWITIYLPANVYDQAASDVRRLAREALGRTPDVVEPWGDRVHNERISVHRETTAQPGWKPRAPPCPAHDIPMAKEERGSYACPLEHGHGLCALALWPDGYTARKWNQPRAVALAADAPEA